MSARDRVLGGQDCVRVAIVQTAPVFLDLERSIDKACVKIAEAAAGGAQLVVFSETWLAGYPYWDEGWNSRADPWMEVRERFFDNALVIPSAQSARLCEAAATNALSVPTTMAKRVHCAHRMNFNIAGIQLV
jgi:predicted amidohydrolase